MCIEVQQPYLHSIYLFTYTKVKDATGANGPKRTEVEQSRGPLTALYYSTYSASLSCRLPPLPPLPP